MKLVVAALLVQLTYCAAHQDSSLGKSQMLSVADVFIAIATVTPVAEANKSIDFPDRLQVALNNRKMFD